MAKKTLADAEETIQRQGDRLIELSNANTKLKEQLQEMKEELQHYKTAVSAVKWLWAQAEKQPPFQL